MTSVVVIKFGGELLDDPTHLATVVAAIARVAAPVATSVGVVPEGTSPRASGAGVEPGAPLVIVHGGGKEIDVALEAAGIDKRQVDGLRITDQATLDIVVGVLAGTVNTRLVAALTNVGVRAVGLTGVDGGCGLSEVAPPHRAADGRVVDLGRVGVPSPLADVRLLRTLLAGRFVPVIASIGVTSDGHLLNVNADTFAGHAAARLEARRLVIAGTTAGVLDDGRVTVDLLEPAAIERLIGSGTATAGMIAKLRACEDALAHGVGDVVIVDGRDGAALEAAVVNATPPRATRIAAAAGRATSPTPGAESLRSRPRTSDAATGERQP